MTANKVTFSFGENWKDFVTVVDELDIVSARQNISEWIPSSNVENKKVIDIGCGSGIHSYCFHKLKASELLSIDVDKSSVDATNELKETAGNPSNWKVQNASILNKDFLRRVDTFDIVYSWGVLHHTGDMWKAIENAANIVRPGGLFWISLYVKGPRYEKDLATKQRYNNLGKGGKKVFILTKIIKIMWKRIKKMQNPLTWNEKVGRGMHKYHDIIDWFGGLPYEVASVDEVVSFLTAEDFKLMRLEETKERSCNIYLFKRNL